MVVPGGLLGYKRRSTALREVSGPASSPRVATPSMAHSPASTHAIACIRRGRSLALRVCSKYGKLSPIANASTSHAPRAAGHCNGRPFVAQIEREGLWYRVQHNGLRLDVQLMSARAAELLRVMPFKAPADMSKFLLSPMPGLLVDIAVQPGQAVQAGERLATIEAMKMENILTAAQDGTVAELLAAKGESLAVDQPIVRFA